jgi:hypothetical protein
MNKITLSGLLITLWALALSSALNAQCRISGRVEDSAHAPLPFAVISIRDKDDTIMQTTFTDSAGRYEIMLSDLSGKQIRVTNVGSAEEHRAIADTLSKQQTIDFALKTQQAVLREITIASAKPLFERKPDRIVFNVSASTTVQGGNAADVLRKTPGVWLRQQDNTINLTGKSGVLVMINDRLQQLSGEDLMALLQAMPADNIEKVEVITAPPAKYDAAGNAGLINIVLKKNKRPGVNGSLRAGYEQASYAKGIAGTELNYRQGKMNCYGNGSYSNGANAIVERLNTPYPGQLYKVTDSYKRTLEPLQYTLGADYELHRNGLMGLQWTSSGMNRRGDDNTSIRIYRLADLSLDSTLRTLGQSGRKNSNNILNLNYVWTIDSAGKKITVNANRLWFNGRRSNDFETTSYSGDFDMPQSSSYNQTEGVQRIRITTAQADMELPCRNFSFSLGAKFSFIDNRSDNHFRYEENGSFYEDPSISNAFDYTERVQALYAGSTATLGKWSLQAGLRAELTQTSGYSRNLNQENSNQYFNLFPTAYIQYQHNDKHSWNLNYSRRINRPDYRSLDPYRAYATLYHYNQGNPFLLPSFNNNVELAYTYGGRYTFSAFYQYEQNHFGSVWIVDAGSNVTSGISKNFADFSSYGLNAAGALRPLPFWEMQAQLSVQMQQLRSKEYTAVEQSYTLPSYYVSLNHSFSLDKERTWIAEANFFYLSRYRDNFLEIDPVGSIDLGIRAQLLDKKLVLALNASDLLATQRGRGRHVVTGQMIDNYFDTRNVRLTATYKFGNAKLKARRERNTGIEEEKGRAGS